MLESKYGITFTGYQYFALADHIDFMIKRTLDGAELNPALLQLMIAKYPKEKDTVDRIAQYLKC